MARPMKPLVKSGGYYPSRRWTPLVYPGGYTTMNGGEPPIPIEWKTVSGSAPLTFSDALSNEIRSLIQYGKCVTSGGDTYCNNGKLMAVHRSGLPSGYKLLEYVGGNGSQYVITDLYLASTDVVECEYRNSSTTGYGAVYGIFKNGESSALYGNQTYYGYDEANNKVDTGMSVDTNWHSSRHDFVNGTLTIDNTSVSFTPFEFVNSTKNAVLSRFYNGSYGYNWKGCVRKFKVTRNGEVVCNLLPAKNSSDVAGLYDLVTGAFYTATGGTLLEGNEVDDYELAVVGTDEVISITASGADTQTATVVNLFAVGDYADTQDIISGAVNRRVGMVRLTGDLPWLYSSGYSESGQTACFFFVLDSILPQTAMSIECFCSHVLWTSRDTMIANKTTTVGAITGSSNNERRGKSVAIRVPVSVASTVAEFGAWLDANGVYLLYPLATPVTEQTTPQPLSTAEGDNVVSVTANVSPIQLSAEYAILSEAG